jgi:hypothetical protein
MGDFEHCDGGMLCMQRMDRIEEMRVLFLISLQHSPREALNKIFRLTSGHEGCLGRITDDDSGRGAHR